MGSLGCISGFMLFSLLCLLPALPGSVGEFIHV